MTYRIIHWATGEGELSMTTDGLPLDADAIFTAAATRSGLQDHADDGMRARFANMVGQLNEFGLVPAPLHAGATEQLTTVVEKRLALARDWHDHPEILEAPIEQPFFVLGSARAGSTLTQSLLTLDEGHHTPRYWEVQHPSPPPGSDPAAMAAARAEQEEYVRFILDRSPRMLQAHPYFDQGADTEAEDEYLYSLDFHIVYPLWLLKVPSVSLVSMPQDSRPALRFLGDMFRQLQWAQPTRRWVGKGVLHQYIPDSLLEVFPDMVGFWIHRRPEEYVASLLEHYDLQYKPFNGPLYRFDAGQMLAEIKAGIDSILANPATGDPRLHHIRFRELVSDPVATIAPVYEARGIPFTAEYERRLRARLADPAHRADRYGKHHYTLERFGLDGKAVRSMFAEYCDRFDL